MGGDRRVTSLSEHDTIGSSPISPTDRGVAKLVKARKNVLCKFSP